MLASPCRAPQVVVKRWWFAGHPFHKCCNFRMGFKRFPSAVVNRQLPFAESRVNLAVADAVNQAFSFAAFAFRHQVMLVHTPTGLQHPAAKRTLFGLQGFDVTQRLGATKRAFGYHLG